MLLYIERIYALNINEIVSFWFQLILLCIKLSYVQTRCYIYDNIIINAKSLNLTKKDFGCSHYKVMDLPI
jgi:hypothetical protein